MKCSEKKKVLTVRGVEIGCGLPKIIIPAVGVSQEEILREARTALEAGADIIEWRSDWFEGFRDPERIRGVLKQLRLLLREVPLLFTFRTAEEGGEGQLSPGEYEALNLMAAGTGMIDLEDIELSAGEEAVRRMVLGAASAGVRTVASSHDFQRTPPREELVRRLCRMQELGADIPKIAVMPQSAADVLTLLSAAEEMHSTRADRPFIAISMGGSGLVSRLCGEIFGSACTFASAGKASAPGQIPADELRTVQQVLHFAKNPSDRPL